MIDEHENYKVNCECCGNEFLTSIDGVSKTKVCIRCRDILARLFIPAPTNIEKDSRIAKSTPIPQATIEELEALLDEFSGTGAITREVSGALLEIMSRAKQSNGAAQGDIISQLENLCVAIGEKANGFGTKEENAEKNNYFWMSKGVAKAIELIRTKGGH